MRTFLSISIPEPVKLLARQMSQKLATAPIDVKWVEYQNYHLTVKFLGDVSPSQLMSIREKMKTVGDNCPPFELKTTNLGFFPNRLRPRIIWLGVGGEVDKAVFLGNRVDAYLSDLGFEPERHHRFHLTLGRLRSDKEIEQMLKITAVLKPELLSFAVNDFNLMESILLPRGPVYKKLDTFTLNG